MAGVDRRRPPGQPVAGHEQRPVEAAAVVGHEPAVGREVRRQRSRAARLVARGPAAGAGPGGTRRPTHQPSPTRNASVPGRRREAGRLRVEADQRRVRRRLAREASPGGAVERDRRGPGPRSGPRSPAASAHDLAVERGGQALGQDVARRPANGAAGRRSSRSGSRAASRVAARVPRRAAGREPPLARAAPAGSIRRASRRAGPEPAVAPRAASSRSASALASTSGSRRGPVQAGQPASHGAGADQVRGPGDELVVALPQALGQPDAARARLVQVDRRRLVVRRADLGHEPEVPRVDHQQDGGHGLDRPPRAEQRDVELVMAPAGRAPRRP